MFFVKEIDYGLEISVRERRRKMMRKLIAALPVLIVTTVLFNVGLLRVASTQEDQYPSKPIKFIIREMPGASGDIGFRALTGAAEKILGQQIISYNIAGGGGARALAALLQEKPDGYALGTLMLGTLVLSHVEKLDFSIPRDFTPVAQVQCVPMPVAVRKDAPWKTWQEAIKFAREHPGKLKVALYGAHSSGWLCLQKIEQKEKVKFTYVPFSATGEAMAALLGGHIDMSTFSSCIRYSKSGELRSLLIFATERIKALPDIPTGKELYGDLGLAFTGGFTGIVAPKGLPEPILIKLQDVFRKALEDPDYLNFNEKFDYLISYKNAQEFREGIKKWDDELKKIFK